MRLKLVSRTPMDDPAEKGWRLLEHGELTLGRSEACGWTLADPERLLSKVHCRIVKAGPGFTLKDESVNGVKVDGIELAEGQTVKLSNGSVVALGDYAFSVEITGEEEPDWSDPDPNLTLGDENLTVTSIIADVSPGGRTASGIVPGRSGDEWIEAQSTKAFEKSPTPALGDAEIGWGGPPDLRLVESPALPDDWNTNSDVAGRSEHMPATSARVRVARAAEPASEERPAAPPQSRDEATAMVAAFLAGARLPPADPADPATFLRAMGGALRDAMDRIATLEAGSVDFLAEQGAERQRETTADPGRLAARLDRLIEDQRLVQDAIRAALDDFVQRFEPHAIEVRADAKATGLLSSRLRSIPIVADRAYWAAYREAYQAGGEGGGPRALFREQLGGREKPRTTDGFEELSSDNPRGRGAA